MMRLWLAMLAGAAVLVGCGIFFAFQDLGKADQYASVASFFLALLTAVGSMVSLARSRSRARTGDRGGEDQPQPPHSTAINLAWGNKVVQQGAQSTMNIDKIVEQQPRNGSHRKR